MEIEKTEKMSFDEFIERKDETFVTAKIVLNEEKVSEYNEEYGYHLSTDYYVSSNARVKLYPKSIKIDDEYIVPLEFIEEVLVTVRY